MVIGRLKVDNYLLAIPYEAPETPEDWKYAVDPKDGKRANKGTLINTSHNGEASGRRSAAVIGFHLGLDGYHHRIKRDHLNSVDVNWNLEYFRNVHRSHGSLMYANFVFRRGGGAR